MNDTQIGYDRKYTTPNFFGDRRWLYRPFIKALVKKTRLKPGMSLLDAGCGQGFFTTLFAEEGINALGVDLSSVGIEVAKKSSELPQAQFQVGDILQLPFERQFDCVFIRSCSLYNTTTFSSDTSVTDQMMRYLRPGGLLIFDYYSRLSPRVHADGWLYHSMAQVKAHFKNYSNHEVYFSLRFDALLLGRFAFSPFISYIANFISRKTGIGGDIVVIVPHV
jgi:SAM-dependent methyltransferase